METGNQEKEYRESELYRIKKNRFILGAFFVAISYFCSQSLMCDILEWVDVDRNAILSIQVLGSVLFSTFSVDLTKDFNLFYGWLNKHPFIKKMVSLIFLFNCKLVWGIIGIALKIPFLVGKYSAGCNEVDDTVNKMIEEYREGTAILKAGLSAILTALEGAAIIYICGIVNYDIAVVSSHIISFIASLLGFVVVISAIWKNIYESDIEDEMNACS